MGRLARLLVHEAASNSLPASCCCCCSALLSTVEVSTSLIARAHPSDRLTSETSWTQLLPTPHRKRVRQTSASMATDLELLKVTQVYAACMTAVAIWYASAQSVGVRAHQFVSGTGSSVSEQNGASSGRQSGRWSRFSTSLPGTGHWVAWDSRFGHLQPTWTTPNACRSSTG